jgi:NTP pyrophosphatase (non-canonical NTP hydrolase)
MSDAETTLAHMRRQVAQFVAARDWGIYHTPSNLSVAIAIEAAELMEHFLWMTGEQATVAMEDEACRDAVAEELADVMIYTLSLANALGVDMSSVVREKLERNEARFPAREWRGRAWGVEREGPGTES